MQFCRSTSGCRGDQVPRRCVQDLIDEVTATVAPMEKTFGCGHADLPCNGH